MGIKDLFLVFRWVSKSAFSLIIFLALITFAIYGFNNLTLWIESHKDIAKAGVFIFFIVMFLYVVIVMVDDKLTPEEKRKRLGMDK